MTILIDMYLKLLEISTSIFNYFIHLRLSQNVLFFFIAVLWCFFIQLNECWWVNNFMCSFKSKFKIVTFVCVHFFFYFYKVILQTAEKCFIEYLHVYLFCMKKYNSFYKIIVSFFVFMKINLWRWYCYTTLKYQNSQK